MKFTARGVSRSFKMTPDEAARISRGAQQLSQMEREVVTVSDFVRDAALQRAARVNEQYQQRESAAAKEQASNG